jgi:hypothetical protein
MGLEVWIVLGSGFRPFIAIGAEPLPRIRQDPPPPFRLRELG